MITAQELGTKLFEKFTISPTKIQFETGHRSFFIDDKIDGTSEFVWFCDDCSIIASRSTMTKIKLEFENWIQLDKSGRSDMIEFTNDQDKLEFIMTYFS